MGLNVPASYRYRRASILLWSCHAPYQDFLGCFFPYHITIFVFTLIILTFNVLSGKEGKEGLSDEHIQ